MLLLHFVCFVCSVLIVVVYCLLLLGVCRCRLLRVSRWSVLVRIFVFVGCLLWFVVRGLTLSIGCWSIVVCRVLFVVVCCAVVLLVRAVG